MAPQSLQIQTLAVQYNVTAIDGDTRSQPFSVDPGNAAYIRPNSQNIFVVNQSRVGLIDPDLGVGGSQGDRFIPWIEVSVDVADTVEVAIVDGQDTSRILRVIQAATPVTPDAPLYLSTDFRCPQGALIRITTGDATTGGYIRLRIKTHLDTCCPNVLQTLAVQYDAESIDGETDSAPFSRDPTTGKRPNSENIYVVKQSALGLIDPDQGIGGSMGDRFLPWIMIAPVADTTVALDVVDAQHTSKVLAAVQAPVAVTPVNPLFLESEFSVPQGAALRVTATGDVGASVRFRVLGAPELPVGQPGPPGPPGPAGAGVPPDSSGEEGDLLELSSTGARWVSDSFNVKLYGAVGDGVADDTLALQAALDAAAVVKGMAFVPPGIYRITATLILAQGTALVGASRDGCVIFGNQLSAQLVRGVFTAFSGVDRQREGRIESLTFHNTSRNAVGGVGLDLRQWTRMIVRECTVFSVETGIRIEGVAFHNELHDVRVHTCYVGSTVKNGANSNKMLGGQIDACLDAAVDLAGGPDAPTDDFSSFGTSFSSNGAVARLDGSAPFPLLSVFFYGPRIEANTDVLLFVPPRSDNAAVRNVAVYGAHASPGVIMATNDAGQRADWQKIGINFTSKISLTDGITSTTWFRETVGATTVRRSVLNVPVPLNGLHVEFWVVGTDSAAPGDFYERRHQAFVYGSPPAIHPQSVVDTPAAAADARIGTIGAADSAIDVSDGTVSVRCDGVAGKTIQWWIVARWLETNAS